MHTVWALAVAANLQGPRGVIPAKAGIQFLGRSLSFLSCDEGALKRHPYSALKEGCLNDRKMDNEQLETLIQNREAHPMKAILACVIGLLLQAPNVGAQQAPAAKRPDVEAKLKTLGIKLPTPAKPIANYVGSVRTGNLVFLAGAGPRKADGTYIAGRLGQDMSIEQGYQAARLIGINQLAALKAEIGDLNKVKRIVKVLGMVNSAPTFTEQPKVVNGFSDLMVEVFGDRGKHARSAVGMAALPMNIPAEVEMIVEVEGQ